MLLPKFFGAHSNFVLGAAANCVPLFWDLLLFAHHTPVFAAEIEFAAFDGKAQTGVVLHEMGAALLGQQGESGVARLAAALYCVQHKTLAYAALAELRQYGQRIEVPFSGEGLDVGGVKLGLSETREQGEGYAAGLAVAFAGVADHRPCPFAVHAGNPCISPGIEGVAAAAYLRQCRFTDFSGSTVCGVSAWGACVRGACAGVWGVCGHICQMRRGENDLPKELSILFARIADGNNVDCFTHTFTNIANWPRIS